MAAPQDPDTGFLSRMKMRLNSGTTLERPRSSSRIADSVINFFRSLIDRAHDDDMEAANITNPHERAKSRFNTLWAGRENYAAFENDSSPVAKLQTLKGAITAYWADKKWEAWTSTATLGGLSTLSGVNALWMSEAYANTMSALFNAGLGSSEFITSTGYFAGSAAIMYGTGVLSMRVGNTLQRNMAAHIKSLFTDAAAESPDIFAHIARKNQELLQDGQAQILPQIAMGKSAEDLSKNLVNLGLGGYESIITIGALTYGLAQNSVPIESVEFLKNSLGDWGTFTAAMAMIGGYSGFTIYHGNKLGKKMEEAQDTKQRADADKEKTLVLAFEKSTNTPEEHMQFMHDLQESEATVAKAWHEHDRAREKYGRFSQASMVGNWVISPLPALSGLDLAADGLSALAQQTYLASHAQIQMLMGTVTRGVDIISARGNIIVPARIITEMAREFENTRAARLKADMPAETMVHNEPEYASEPA